MSSSYFAISVIKQRNLPKEQLAIFLLNLSKKALCDFLHEAKILNKPINLTKSKMIELIINCNATKSNNEVNRITGGAERLRLDNA